MVLSGRRTFTKLFGNSNTLESVALPGEPAVLCELLCIHPADKEESVESLGSFVMVQI